jgi:hypothetical protein
LTVGLTSLASLWKEVVLTRVEAAV